MFTEARKLSLIEAIIQSSDDSMLTSIESLLKDKEPANGKDHKPGTSFSDLVGTLTVEEAELMQKTIDAHFDEIKNLQRVF